MLDRWRIAICLVLAGTLGACAAAQPSHPADVELARMLRENRDADIVEPFARRRSPEPPARLRILVSDRPGQIAPPDSALGNAMRRVVDILARNGVDAKLVTEAEPYNFLLDAMDPSVGTTAGPGERFGARDMRPNMSGYFPGIDTFVFRDAPAGSCRRTRVTPVEGRIPTQAGDHDLALEHEDRRNPLLHSLVLPLQWSQLAFHVTGSAREKDAPLTVWRDLALSCAFGGIMFGGEDMIDFIPRSATFNLSCPESHEAIVSTSEPERRFSRKQQFACLRGLGGQPNASVTPTFDVTALRILAYLITMRDGALDRVAQIERMRVTLARLRAKYDAPEPRR